MSLKTAGESCALKIAHLPNRSCVPHKLYCALISPDHGFQGVLFSNTTFGKLHTFDLICARYHCTRSGSHSDPVELQPEKLLNHWCRDLHAKLLRDQALSSSLSSSILSRYSAISSVKTEGHPSLGWSCSPPPLVHWKIRRVMVRCVVDIPSFLSSFTMEATV